jgi:adhesin transport system outer membrane protein
VALNAIEAYIDVNRHNRLLQLARGHVARHEELLSIIKQRLDGGAAPIGDLEQTLERLESAKALVAQIDVAREAAIAKYKASVGSKPTRLKHVPYARNLPKSPAAVMASALVNNARIKATSSEIDVAGFDKEQFRSSLYPKLFLEGSATRGENLEGTPGTNDELKAMLVLRWRLYDGGVRQGRIAELAEREYEKVAERDILLTEIEEIVDTAWGRFTKGWAQVDALKRQSVQTKKVIATYQDEYNANTRSLLDVLDAENSNFGTEFELSNVQALHVFSSYQLLAQMGVLLDRLGVHKPEGVNNSFETPKPSGKVSFGSGFEIPPLR